MRIQVMIRLNHHTVTGDKLISFENTLAAHEMKEIEDGGGTTADISHAAMLMIGDNGESIPLFVSCFANPYHDNVRCVLATDCETFEQAKEMKEKACGLVQEVFGKNVSKRSETSWTNPILN